MSAFISRPLSLVLGAEIIGLDLAQPLDAARCDAGYGAGMMGFATLNPSYMDRDGSA